MSNQPHSDNDYPYLRAYAEVMYSVEKDAADFVSREIYRNRKNNAPQTTVYCGLTDIQRDINDHFFDEIREEIIAVAEKHGWLPVEAE